MVWCGVVVCCIPGGTRKDSREHYPVPVGSESQGDEDEDENGDEDEDEDNGEFEEQ